MSAPKGPSPLSVSQLETIVRAAASARIVPRRLSGVVRRHCRDIAQTLSSGGQITAASRPAFASLAVGLAEADMVPDTMAPFWRSLFITMFADQEGTGSGSGDQVGARAALSLTIGHVRHGLDLGFACIAEIRQSED